MSDIESEPTREQIAFFREHGYLHVERITTDEEIERLGALHDELFGAGGGYFDVTRPFGRTRDPRLLQMIFPEQRAAELTGTTYYRNARGFAAALLGRSVGEIESWGHALCKPARVGHRTPLHQDEAYWEPDFDYHAVGAWLPLADVDSVNGCMCFVPGSHRGEVLTHRPVGGDPTVHLLEIDGDVELSAAVPVPLSKGGATFHAQRTLHFTGPNSSAAPRRVFAFEFQAPPVRRATPAPRPWRDEQREALASVAAGPAPRVQPLRR